jgi:hypothetical protein
MTRLIRVELLKLRTVRLSWGLLAAAAGITAVFAVLNATRDKDAALNSRNTPQVVDGGCPHQRDGDSHCSGEAGECEDRAWSGDLG